MQKYCLLRAKAKNCIFGNLSEPMIPFLVKLRQEFSLFITTLMSYLKWLLMPKHKFNLIDTAKGDIYILATGPSLNPVLQQHAAFFHDKKTMCVNHFALSDYYSIIQPSYYLLLDPLYFADPQKLEPANLKAQILSLIEKIKTKTHWPIIFLAPAHTAKKSFFIQHIQQNSHIHVHFFNYIVMEGFPQWIYPFYRSGKGMPQCQNVCVAAAFLSTIMGFHNIYLLGADHSWHTDIRVNQQNEVVIVDKHFYDAHETSERVMYKDPIHKIRFTMAELFLAWHKVFAGYEKVNAFSRSQGKNIYNATTESFIDAFPRKTLFP